MTPTHTELWYLTIREAGQLLKRRELSPVELTRVFLDRIETLDSKLQAYITVLPQRAMAAARTAEAEMLRGDYRGPLHGIPIALKDLYDTRGIRTTASSRVMADRVPTKDATATARLEAAGSILLGKLAMHEFALGGPDPTCGFPLARNPWNLAHIPGGSSSGSGYCRGGRALHGVAGLLHGWLDPRSGGLLQSGRAQADLRTGKSLRRRTTELVVGPLRPDDLDRRRYGVYVAGDCWP